MARKHEVIVIHGGEAFPNYRAYLRWLKGLRLDRARMRSGKKEWKATLESRLGRNWEVLLPAMPGKLNAKYAEWCIIMDKLLPLVRNGVVLVGHSLGGVFLAKYLATAKPRRRIAATALVAAPFAAARGRYALGDFGLPRSLAGLERNGGRILLYHSTDDPVVPYGDALRYRKALPGAVLRTLRRRGHVNQASFSELVRDLKRLLS